MKIKIYFDEEVKDGSMWITQKLVTLQEAIKRFENNKNFTLLYDDFNSLEDIGILKQCANDAVEFISYNIENCRFITFRK